MKKSRKILIGVLICVIIGSVSYIGYYYVTQNKNEKVYKKLQKEVVKQESKEEEPQTEESHVEIPIDFAQLQAQNPDIYAWIQIDGTNINYPVVQSATDNEYYLNHTIEGQEGYPGSIYTENWNTKEFTDFNTVIYGHDMKDGSMFQNLHNYADASYMQQHPNVVIYTPEKKFTYQIFAAVVYDDRHILHSFDYAFADQRQAFLDSIYNSRNLGNVIRDDDRHILHSFDYAFADQRQAFLDSIYNSRNLGNVIRDDVSVNTDSRILKLSNCMTGQDDKLFLVEAVLISEED